MKNHFSILLAGLLVWSAGDPARAEAGKPAPAAKPAPIRSTFTMPKQFSEGRDPFFPDSSRVYQAVLLESPNRTKADVSLLVVKGINRDAKGTYVIINNHTFTVGDEGDVTTSGGRIHLKCVDVLPNAVVIESGGALHQLPINLKK